MPLLLAIMGPTASGKTPLAEALATEYDAQLVNADAFQVYRGMDIGTAKPADRSRYLLLDIKRPDEAYGVGEFTQRALNELERLFLEGRNVIVVGGTGLYIRALFEQYSNMDVAPNPELRKDLTRIHEQQGLAALVARLTSEYPDIASKTDLRNPVRVIRAIERSLAPQRVVLQRLPAFTTLKLAIDLDMQTLQLRFEQRVRTMVQNGWVREVSLLKDAGYSPSDPGFRAIGYLQIWEHLSGQVELGEACATTIADTRRYAKRQKTWLRSEPNLVVLRSECPFQESLERIKCVFQ